MEHCYLKASRMDHFHTFLTLLPGHLDDRKKEERIVREKKERRREGAIGALSADLEGDLFQILFFPAKPRTSSLSGFECRKYAGAKRGAFGRKQFPVYLRSPHSSQFSTQKSLEDYQRSSRFTLLIFSPSLNTPCLGP